MCLHVLYSGYGLDLALEGMPCVNIMNCAKKATVEKPGLSSCCHQDAALLATCFQARLVHHLASFVTDITGGQPSTASACSEVHSKKVSECE
jgi:hypothetical protein